MADRLVFPSWLDLRDTHDSRISLIYPTWLNRAISVTKRNLRLLRLGPIGWGGGMDSYGGLVSRLIVA
jgi:hypothetical protein